MEKLNQRLAALSPEQRQLLERQLQEKGLASSLLHSTTSLVVKQAVDQEHKQYQQLDSLLDGKRIKKGMQFSLFFFSADGSKATADKYQMLFKSTRFADEHGFSAVWTPERHFQDFGGLYPNPSVLSAALAMITKRVGIRAGSVVLPLHNPIRIAEEWAVVDNLSRGRIGISFASGWHPNDFVLAPHVYEHRKEMMIQGIHLIERLWAGEVVPFPGVDGCTVHLKILPRPIQKKLPVWLTTSGSPETWMKAGEMGANILASLIGYSVQDLAKRIALYRESLAGHGHDPHKGQVTVMLHTFVGDDTLAIKEKVRAPLYQYLQTYMQQKESMPTKGDDPNTKPMTVKDKETVVSFAFERYFNMNSLLGAPDKCAEMLNLLRDIDVDEVACLIDFGVDTESTMKSLGALNELREQYE